MYLYCLYLEMGGVSIYYSYPPTVLAWRIGCKDAVARQIMHENLIRYLVLFKDPHVSVGLSHPLQILLKSPVTPIPYVLRTKKDTGFPVLSRPYAAPPRTSSCRPARS